MMSLCHAVLRGLGGRCVCVSPCVERGGQVGLLLEPNEKNYTKIDHVGSLVAALKGGGNFKTNTSRI